MTLVLQKDEEIEKSLLIDSIQGKGILYITNKSLVVLIDKEGILFERLHTQMYSITAIDKRRVKIVWVETNDTLFDFTFKTKEPNAIQHIKDILSNHDYTDNFPNIVIKQTKKSK